MCMKWEVEKLLKCTMLTSEDLIPKDGSEKKLEELKTNITDKSAFLTVYPDIHYKKGSRVINGMAFCSRDNILPACLGVENCGFTMGIIASDFSKQELEESFRKYVDKEKEPYVLSETEMFELYDEYLRKDFEENKTLYKFLGYKNVEELFEAAHKALDSHIIRRARYSLGNLGGGNHFFELHEVVESTETCDVQKGQYIYIIHSDSIAVGDYVNLLFSNLSELDFMKGTWEGTKKRIKIRLAQILFFAKKGLFFSDLINIINLLYSQNDYRLIPMESKTGKELLLYHNLAAIFGDMNRDEIVKRWAKISSINYTKKITHPHDNITIEIMDGENTVVQRNGVQRINKDPYYVLPGAMGTELYVLENTRNEKALYSANHGTGRINDKHIARTLYSETDTQDELVKRNVKLFRVGKGNIAEQNLHAFKGVEMVVQEMEKQNLGRVVAKTVPFAIIKG